QGRARQAHVPHPGEDRSRAIAGAGPCGEKRPARVRLCEAGSVGGVPARIAREAAAMIEYGPSVARIEGITQRYEAAIALEDVDIEIPSGRMAGLIGPDGVGKSTLLSIIAGAREIQTGKAFV